MSKSLKRGAAPPAALQQLLEEGLRHYGIDHTAGHVARLCLFLSELMKWNERMNLVGLKYGDVIVTELLYDAFFLHTCVRDAPSVLDLGSGSGVVSVPLSVLNDAKAIFSLDKSLKKIQFQRHVRRLLALTNLTVLHGRARDIPSVNAHAVVAKAFGPMTEVLAEAGRHLRGDGYLFVAAGKGDRAAQREGFLLEDVRSYSLPKSGKKYQLFVYKKISQPDVLC